MKSILILKNVKLKTFNSNIKSRKETEEIKFFMTMEKSMKMETNIF
jgi:hypothetical protein